jgi:DNA-binding NarL/FixJ family response regulator
MSLFRVLLVEDEPWVRQGVAQLLDDAPAGSTIAAACSSAEEALVQVKAGLTFDVALVDVGLPGMSGIELIRSLRRSGVEGVAVVFTVFDDPNTILDALRAGARGYLLKSTPFPRLRAALLEAMEGGAPMTPSIARLLVEQVAAAGAPEPGDDARALTRREREVLALLTKGLTYADVARALGLGLGTVQSHVKSIYGKLEVASKAEAAAVATRLGMA